MVVDYFVGDGIMLEDIFLKKEKRSSFLGQRRLLAWYPLPGLIAEACMCQHTASAAKH
jgi:hypothetical protein